MCWLNDCCINLIIFVGIRVSNVTAGNATSHQQQQQNCYCGYSRTEMMKKRWHSAKIIADGLFTFEKDKTLFNYICVFKPVCLLSHQGFSVPCQNFYVNWNRNPNIVKNLYCSQKIFSIICIITVKMFTCVCTLYSLRRPIKK